jgi:hypothetical protein
MARYLQVIKPNPISFIHFSKGRIMVMKKFMPLDEFYDSRLSGLKDVDPKEMGVACDVGRIGGYLNTGDYRKAKTFADIEKRRAKVDRLLEKYK